MRQNISDCGGLFLICCVFLGLGVLLSGCSGINDGNQSSTNSCEWPSPTDQSGEFKTPTRLARMIRDANLIVVTNKFPYPFNQHQGFNLTGAEVKPVVQAVSTARQYPDRIMSDSVLDCVLRFYKGNRYLGKVCFKDDVIKANGEFVDQTGVLNPLYDRFIKLEEQ